MDKHKCPFCGGYAFYLYKLDSFKIVPRCMDCENEKQEGWQGILRITNKEYQSSNRRVKT